MRFWGREKELPFRPLTNVSFSSENKLSDPSNKNNFDKNSSGLQFKKLPEIKNEFEFLNKLKKEIFNLKKLPKRQFGKEKKINRKFIFFFALALILLVSFFLFKTQLMSLTGFVVKDTQSSMDLIEQNISESQNYEWHLEHYGQLINAKLSGKLILLGEGSVKVYLEDKLLLDSSKLEKKKTVLNTMLNNKSLITGFAVEEQQTSVQVENVNTSEELNPEENLSTPKISGLEEIPLEENLTEPSPEENATNITQENMTQENATQENVSGGQENITLPEGNQTENITEENITVYEIDFSNICVETCDLEEFNLTKEKYNLRIEIENASLLLNSMNYEIKELGENVTHPEENITEVNITENFTEQLIQYNATIGQPVKWSKTIFVENATLEEPKEIRIKLPKESKNITLNKIEKKKIKEKKQEKFDFNDTGEEILINIHVTAQEYEISYETPAPQINETEINQKQKEIKIKGPDSVHYQNVLAYTNISEVSESEKGKIKLYWLVNDSEILVENITYIDSNNDSLIERIAWIVPHLSEQDFLLIIEITNAEHLDENYTFISNVYNETYALDGIWSEPIYHNEYVRVTFKENLTSSNDITVYARNNQNSNTKIEVYYFNSSEKITEFPIITDKRYYKAYLANMSGSHATFDLKIKNLDNVSNAYLEFDHIVDPDTTPPMASFGTNPIDNYNDNDGSVTFDMKCSDNVGVSFLQLWGNWSTPCSGNLNCDGVSNKPGCNACNKCSFIYATCSGTKNCAVWNGNQTGCQGAPPGSCTWVLPNCMNLALTCAQQISEANCDYMNAAGCITNGLCANNGACSAITEQTMCSTGCGSGFGCSWGSWQANQTNSSPINDTWWNITVPGIPNGFFKWAVWCNDTSNNPDWTDTNRTFNVLISMKNVTNCVDIVSPGFYNITQNITNGTDAICIVINSDNVTLEGNGFYVDGINGSNRSNSIGIYLLGTQNNVTIQDINIANWDKGVYLVGNSNSIIQNFNFSEILKYGVYLYSNSNNNTVYRNKMNGIIEIGIYIDSSNLNNISLNNLSTTGDISRFGFSLYDSNNNFIFRNRLSSLNYSMKFESSVNNTVQENTVEDAIGAAIELSNTNSSRFISNNLTNASSAGFNLTNAYSNDITSNYMRNILSAGFILTGSYLNNLTGNVIDNVTESGFYLYDSDNNSVTLNNITEMQSSGINLISGDYNNITGNKFINPGLTSSATGINLLSSLRNRIDNNEMINLTAGGIKLNSSDENQLINNSYNLPITASPNIAIWLISSSNNNVTDGIFSGGIYIAFSDLAFIDLENSNYNRIENVTIPASWRGLYMDSSNNNTFSGLKIWSVSKIIELFNSTNTTLVNSNFSRYSYSSSYSPYFYKSDFNSLNNSGTNLMFNSSVSGYLNETYVDFYGSDFDFREDNDTYTTQDGSYGWIGKIFMLRVGSTAISFNVSYTNEDLVNYSIHNESTLIMQYYTGGIFGWDSLSNSGVNETENYVWSNPNSTTFSTEKPIAPFGEVDLTAPIASFGTNPVDNYNDTDGSIVFDLKCSDNINVSYIQLWTNTTGTWHANYTNSSMSNYNNTWLNITVTGIPQGQNYKWAVWCNDTSDNSDWTGTNRTFNVKNTAPTIDDISTIPLQNITEGGVTNVTFFVNVSDANGYETLDVVNTTFTKTGEGTRYNSSCKFVANYNATQANYSCIIGIWYWDGAGNWSINATANDSGELVSSGYNETFELSQTTSFAVSPNAISFLTITPGTENVTSNNDPSLLNNTGNANIPLNNISIRALDLYGEDNQSYFINSANFSIDIETGSVAECAGDSLSNNSYVNITGSILPAGNNSLNYGNETSGQEQLYYCIKQISTTLIAQKYSTNFLGSWIIQIIASMVLIVPARRKKKKLDEEKLFTILQLSINELKERYALSTDEIIKIAEKKSQEKTIPLAIFQENLGALETIVKYLKENLNLSYHEIARLLNRDDRTIWTTYQIVMKKKKEKIEIKSNRFLIPLSVFSNRKLSILESLISYLKEKNLSFKEISELINRDQRNIWTINSRAKKKIKDKPDKSEERLFKMLKLSIGEIKEKYSLSQEEIMKIGEGKSQEKTVPLSLFKENLGVLEILVKYLKENLGLPYHEIAKLLNRDDRTIWATYKNTLKKKKEKLEVKQSKISIPLSIFVNRKLSILESLILYLKEKGFSFKEISKLINRDQRNIWTINSRAKGKFKSAP
ncbi:MAG: right-handed parallel beta-helix repeat-containing protein [Candidatus Pacearchaeota archaeon]|nr:right-handed parallel beta-helix repeat-containing protein [Candidatus Pacearchaeota archaeon]